MSRQVAITEQGIEVRFQKRAHNPLLQATGFDKTDVPIPWLGGVNVVPAYSDSRT